MQPTLTTAFPTGSTWSQAYGWTSDLAQDLQHRHTTTGWSATAVWGFSDKLSSTAVWNATSVWGTLAGETGRSSLEASHLALNRNDRRDPRYPPRIQSPTDSFAAAGGWIPSIAGAGRSPRRRLGMAING